MAASVRAAQDGVAVGVGLGVADGDGLAVGVAVTLALGLAEGVKVGRGAVAGGFPQAATAPAASRQMVPRRAATARRGG
jgi:hypothetical protein